MNQTQKNTAFHALNVIGWSLFGAINIFLRGVDGSLDQVQWAISVLYIVTGVTTGIVVRYLFHRLKLHSTSFWSRLIKVLTVIFLVSLVMTASAFAIAKSLIYPIDLANKADLNAFLANVVTMGILLCIWCALYWLVHAFIALGQSEQDRQHLQEALAQSQLNQLSHQLNPHFLFNSLNNIRSLIRSNPDKSRDMITELAHILRRSLTMQERQFTSVKEEIEIVHSVLEIARLQLGERLNVKMHIAPECEPLLLPTFVIQLLTENAIKHGLSEMPEGGELLIEVKRVALQIYVRVRNDTPSTPPNSSDKNTGIGLNNIRKRLRLLYGDHATMTVEHSPKHFEINLCLPLRA